MKTICFHYEGKKMAHSKMPMNISKNVRANEN